MLKFKLAYMHVRERMMLCSKTKLLNSSLNIRTHNLLNSRLMMKNQFLFGKQLLSSSIIRDGKSIISSSVYIAKANQSNAALAALKYYTAIGSLFLMRNYRQIKARIEGKPVKPKEKKEYPADVVILCQFPRAYPAPSLSPFGLKLETWIRAAGIKYQNELSMARSSQGLMPFIKLNGFQVEDSQKCIEYLSQVYDLDMNKDLTPDQKAISRAVLKMTEESLRWSLVLHRFYYSTTTQRDTNLPKLAIWIFHYRMYHIGMNNGFLRMPKEELYESGRKDLQAINQLIGPKKFLFSDTHPCDTDFSVFGTCIQFKLTEKGPLHHYLMNECPNILRHIDTMLDLYWKDWDEHTLQGRSKLKKLKAAADAAKASTSTPPAKP